MRPEDSQIQIYMREALLEAEKAFAADEVPVGAVLVHRGEIVSLCPECVLNEAIDSDFVNGQGIGRVQAEPEVLRLGPAGRLELIEVSDEWIIRPHPIDFIPCRRLHERIARIQPVLQGVGKRRSRIRRVDVSRSNQVQSARQIHGR